MTVLAHDADEVLLAFTRAVRAAGVAVTHDRGAGFLDAASRLGAGDPRSVHAAGRATLCGSPDDLARYDRVYEAFFGDTLPEVRLRPRSAPPVLDLGDADDGGGEGDGDVVRTRASDVEVLRHRDVAGLSDAEKAQVARLLAGLPVRLPRRRAHRRTPWHRGQVDARRTVRGMVRHHGEPARIAWRRQGTRTRRVVLLLDVSGSMAPYADTLLRLAHRMVSAGPASVEVFTLGTRLTRVTRPLRHRDAEQALAATGDAVPDWAGGTRLGETLRAFLDRWGQRGVARGAVVVVFSDGWERGETTLLGEQAARLRRLAHRVVWVNPHRGRPGYEPVQGGVLAVLPHVDDFVAGHSVAAYTELCEVVGRA